MVPTWVASARRTIASVGTVGSGVSTIEPSASRVSLRAPRRAEAR